MPIRLAKPPHFYAVDHVAPKGTWYSYFGRTLGYKPAIRIHPNYHDDPVAFRATYGRLLAEEERNAPVQKVKAGTVAAYGHQFLASARFKGYADNTKRNVRQSIDRLIEDYGDKSMAKLTPKAVQSIIDNSKRPDTTVNHMVKTLGMLAKLAIRDGVLTANPVNRNDVDIRRVKTKHTPPWPLEQCERFRERWPIGTKQRTAFEIGFHTARRGVGVCALQWAHLTGDELRAEQGKVGEGAFFSVVRSGLREALDATPKDSLFVIGTARGQRSVKSFYNWFRDAANAAGVDPQLSFHGLRATAAVMALEAGCTEDEAMAITGHRSRTEFQRYVRDVRQQVLAKAGAAKLENAPRTDSVKLSRKL